MKQIIQNQTVDFDTHQAGDGQEVNTDAIHLHKRMNGKIFKGVDVKIPLDPNKEIIYTGNNSKLGNRIINEVRNVFNKKPEKVRELAIELADIISRYTQNMNAGDSKIFLENASSSIAKHFDLKPKIKDSLVAEINKHITFFITTHEDEYGKLYYIKQDLYRQKIRVGDDIEKIFFANN